MFKTILCCFGNSQDFPEQNISTSSLMFGFTPVMDCGRKGEEWGLTSSKVKKYRHVTPNNGDRKVKPLRYFRISTKFPLSHLFTSNRLNIQDGFYAPPRTPRKRRETQRVQQKRERERAPTLQSTHIHTDRFRQNPAEQ